MKKATKVLFKDVDEYISLQPEERRAGLEAIREAIKKGAPTAEEVISYQMPAYKQSGKLAFFAGYKNHYGLYFPTAINAFKDKLVNYKVSKATIQLPVQAAIPKRLITEMVKYTVKANLEKAGMKELVKKTAKNN